MLKNGKLKLCDFNFSKTLATSEVTYTCLGTKKYADPQIARQREVGFESDIYSIGSTLK